MTKRNEEESLRYYTRVRRFAACVAPAKNAPTPERAGTTTPQRSESLSMKKSEGTRAMGEATPLIREGGDELGVGGRWDGSEDQKRT